MTNKEYINNEDGHGGFYKHMSNFLYHITPQKNYDNIIKTGLCVNSNYNGLVSRRDSHHLYNKQYGGVVPIFLASELSTIFSMLSTQWIKIYNPVLLKVDIFDLNLKAGKYYSEWISMNDIQLERITYIRHITPLDIIQLIQ